MKFIRALIFDLHFSGGGKVLRILGAGGGGFQTCHDVSLDRGFKCRWQ